MWLDNTTAARALLGLSRKIVGQGSTGITDDDIDAKLLSNGQKRLNEKFIQGKDSDSSTPRGFWRKGINHSQSKRIFLRFATKMDRKYGNPNLGGKFSKSHNCA